MATTIIRLPKVKAKTGLSRSTIYLRISEGTFPKQVQLGARAVGWIESEIDQWLVRQIERSRGPRNEVDSRVGQHSPESTSHSAGDPSAVRGNRE